MKKIEPGVDITDRGPWISTRSRGRFYPLDPKPEEVEIEDIAWALSNVCRFGGHINRFYSVAEHSVHVANQCKTKEIAQWGLLHDATEAYIGDMVRPLKYSLNAFTEIEKRVMWAIAKRFNLKGVMPKEVKHWDHVLCATEKAMLFDGTEVWPNMPEEISLELIVEVSPYEGYHMFMEKYKELFDED